jgi:hypothetical protein
MQVDDLDSAFDYFLNVINNKVDESTTETKPPFDIFKTCNHGLIENIKSIDTCIECGKELGRVRTFEKEWQYYEGTEGAGGDPSRCHYRKVNDKTILNDVSHMGFSKYIIDKANNLFDDVTNGSIYRGNSRKAIVFACIFESYKQAGQPKSLEFLQNKFGLQRKVISKGINHVGMNTSKKKSSCSSLSPVDLIKETMKKLEADEKQIKNTMEIYNNIKNRSSLLNRSKPRSISTGVIWFYCVYTKKTITIKELSTISTLSEATIDKIAKEIDRIFNYNLFVSKRKRK